MHYQLKLTLTDEDYLNFNYFVNLETVHGKKNMRKTILLFVLVVVLTEVLFFFLWEVSPLSIILVAVLTILFVVLFKPMMKKGIKDQVKQMKKAGKLPFDSLSTIEFYDDKLVEHSENKRSEYAYATIERICIVKDQYVYLLISGISGYIIPFSQIAAQTDRAGFLHFLQSKISITEYY